ncbi:MAG: hypothetical protein IBJ03_19170 [Gemmatimonadaceae bacterium]|nr:hypothetical protein [Gemmatimonadaceae bacterium]
MISLRWATRYGCVALTVLTATTPLRVDAQNLVLYGQLRSEEDKKPIAGAMLVAEVARTGTHRVTAVTNRDGRFALAVGDSAGIRVRVLRLGHRPFMVGAIGPLFPGPATIAVPNLTVTLAAIKIESRSNCVSSAEDGSTLATVLGEIDKALELSTRRGTDTRYRASSRQRIEETIFSSGRTRRIGERVTNNETASPFVSAPIAELLRDGYVIEDGQEMLYRAPDAMVLLAPEFRNTHCFRVVESKDATGDLVGVEFTPLKDRGKHVDVRGTMWVDRTTSRLQKVEFNYDGLPPSHRHREIGGHFALGYLPDGLVYVREWSIRMPLVEEDKRADVAGAMRLGSNAKKVAGLRIERGEVISMSTGGQVVYQAPADPAAGASGANTAVAAEATTTPSNVPLSACPDSRGAVSGDTLTVLQGQLLNMPAGDGSPFVVTARWREQARSLEITDWTIRELQQSVTVRGPTYYICNIPTERPLTIIVTRRGQTLGQATVNAPRGAPSITADVQGRGR